MLTFLFFIEMEELRDDKNHKIVSELSVWGV